MNNTKSIANIAEMFCVHPHFLYSALSQAPQPIQEYAGVEHQNSPYFS